MSVTGGPYCTCTSGEEWSGWHEVQCTHCWQQELGLWPSYNTLPPPDNPDRPTEDPRQARGSSHLEGK